MSSSVPPKVRRKSSASNTAMRPTESSRPEPTIIKRRNSSFASTSSPWFRRNSFLSPSMIKNENFSVYEAPSYYSDASSYSIISLKECQGFIFNQDLFATPYQQSRSLANEKKIRALSFSKSASRSRSQSKSITPTNSVNCSTINSPQQPQQTPSQPQPQSQRRHTSYHSPRPNFLQHGVGLGLGAALEVDNDDDAIFDDSIEEDIEEIPFESSFVEDDEDAIADEYDEYEDYEEMNGYGGDSTNRRYKVHVTEIIVNEKDNDIFPS
ncbi:protein whose overexpression suppresses the synthetic lethality of the hal3 sit4 double mutation [Scheffersomyces xylosifermentans]|uniref:protein whose overexpression suppresses the synthetic lethality of the hal3 sit4 double mutation n=1 Tax=Scheffersomyces xylosifermentans TaxID=1304137 RepID=UPI00315D298C